MCANEVGERGNVDGRQLPQRVGGLIVEGPNGWVFAYDDPVVLSKALVKFAGDHDKLAIKGGVFEGRFMDPAGVKVLSQMPSKPELQAKLLAMINAPGYSRPDQWQVQIQAQILLKSKVLVKNGFMSDHEIRAAHLEPLHDVRDGVLAALKSAGPAAT